MDGDIQEVDTLTRSIAVDSAVQQQLGELAAADPETATYYYLLTGVRPLLLEKLYQSRQLSSIQYTDLYGHTLTIGEEMPDPAPEHGAQMEALLEQKVGGFALLPPVDADYPYLLCGRAILQSKNVQPGPAGHRDRRPGRGRAAGWRDRQPVHPAERTVPVQRRTAGLQQRQRRGVHPAGKRAGLSD